jgi:hypothetical protein
MSLFKKKSRHDPLRLTQKKALSQPFKIGDRLLTFDSGGHLRYIADAAHGPGR